VEITAALEKQRAREACENYRLGRTNSFWKHSSPVSKQEAILKSSTPLLPVAPKNTAAVGEEK